MFATITTERPSDGTAVITIDGPLDVYSAPDTRTAFIDAINEGRYRQVADLSAVTLLDSTGLGVLIGQCKRLRARGGDLVLVVGSERTRKVLRITGVHKTIETRCDVAEALAVFDADAKAGA